MSLPSQYQGSMTFHMPSPHYKSRIKKFNVNCVKTNKHRSSDQLTNLSETYYDNDYAVYDWRRKILIALLSMIECIYNLCRKESIA